MKGMCSDEGVNARNVKFKNKGLILERSASLSFQIENLSPATCLIPNFNEL